MEASLYLLTFQPQDFPDFIGAPGFSNTPTTLHPLSTW
ncbi:hypothetical protein DICTH_1804 [Dictyoglomus thermophilum H-6-12]|uniref:Uncharacterized protein n=1 Tax=Dictyoglomus thermophilum (strain ATCC 35947 / DSM 3960 / H-6-12) TaxID=309799 RepID=B5YB90_DICT6|nr:hypothetical protein DICTH_1804 [Dictyoglomus thermophilum H-6-12]